MGGGGGFCSCASRNVIITRSTSEKNIFLKCFFARPLFLVTIFPHTIRTVQNMFPFSFSCRALIPTPLTPQTHTKKKSPHTRYPWARRSTISSSSSNIGNNTAVLPAPPPRQAPRPILLFPARRRPRPQQPQLPPGTVVRQARPTGAIAWPSPACSGTATGCAG